MCPCSRKSLSVRYDRADHQPYAYTCPILNSHCWIPGGRTPDSDRGPHSKYKYPRLGPLPSRHLISETLSSIIFLLHLFSATYIISLNLYYAATSFGIWAYLVSTTPVSLLFFLAVTRFFNTFSLESVRNISSIKRFMGFYSSLERVTHQLVTERNLTPTLDICVYMVTH